MATKISLVYANPDAARLLGSSGNATTVNRTWVLNDIGSATYELPITEPDLETITQFGAIHWLYEDDTPTFVGYVEERSWSSNSVRIGLRSAEGLLRGQLTRQGLVLGAGSPTSAGVVAYNVFISGVLRNSTVPLRAGVFDAAGARFVALDYADVFEVFSKLAENYSAAFWVDEDLNTHFRTARGSDKSEQVFLFEGRNLINFQLNESIADSINAAVGVGDKEPTSEVDGIAARYKAPLRYPVLGRFKAEVLNLSEAADPETVKIRTKEAIIARRNPVTTIDAELVRSAVEFGQFGLGDIVKVVSTAVPWIAEYNCRVIGMEIGQEDKMRLVLEVIWPAPAVEPSAWVLT
jgi:hypothetical protein